MKNPLGNTEPMRKRYLKRWEEIIRGRVWYNTETNEWLRISSFGGKVGRREYLIEIESTGGRFRGVKGNPFKTKSEALSFAKQYMGKH